MIPGVPYDEELEYIESTGTQWIDTGYVGRTNTRFELDAASLVKETSQIGSVYSKSQEKPYFAIDFGGGTFFLGTGNSYPAFGYSSARRIYSYNAANGLCICGEQSQYGYALQEDQIVSMYLFARNMGDNTAGLHCNMRVYGFRGYYGDMLACDLIPVRVNGVAKMYDRVTRTFPAHYGTFVAGPVVARPVMGLHFYPWVYTARDYIQDGLIAMWDGIENAGWGTHDPSATVWKDLIDNRDWTLGTSTSYEWTANSFDAKDQFAATQDFIASSVAESLEICCVTKNATDPTANTAWILLGRSWISGGPYFGLLYRSQFTSMMACRGYYHYTYPAIKGLKTSFSFPSFNASSNAVAYFNGSASRTTYYNTFDYNETTRGTVARIGGTAQQSMPIEVFNIRLYSRALTASEIAHNNNIDKWRFNLP